eukprot:GHVT01007366.1.p1 GENE.GHVT01007366.1~~GHVT01007366.1.p1  ORF type:complete len:649 (+),score=186.44 GHVT01007366.1:980-2926(+)
MGGCSWPSHDLFRLSAWTRLQRAASPRFSPMRYRSTRSPAGETVSFATAVLLGLAADGGLIVPIAIPHVDSSTQDNWRCLPYAGVAFEVFRLFIDECEMSDAELREVTDKSYGRRCFFRERQVVKLVDVKQRNSSPSLAAPRPLQTAAQGHTDHEGETPQIHAADPPSPAAEQTKPKRGRMLMLELFHGPTFAFKDIPLQFVGHLFDFFMEKFHSTCVVLGATSGDTGSAAIASVRGRARVDVVILYPAGRTSEIQRRQMTTADDANVHCIAVEGSFDECQSMVKAAFRDSSLSALLAPRRLCAANSINFARILAQIVYYFVAAFEAQAMHLGDAESSSSPPPVSLPLVDFVVPTGNFGNVMAAFYARQMGAPIGRLVVATNSNDILKRFNRTGVYQPLTCQATSSPAMDIQVASNFERFLFDLLGREGQEVVGKFRDLELYGTFDVQPPEAEDAKTKFLAYSASEEETLETIRSFYYDRGMLIDPHTAVGCVAALKFLARAASKEKEEEEEEDKKDQGEEEEETEEATSSGRPLVCVATAHPGKFPATIAKAIGEEEAEQIKYPHELQRVLGLPERFETLPEASSSALVSYLLSKFAPRPPPSSLSDRLNRALACRPATAAAAAATATAVASAAALFFLLRRQQKKT